MKHAFAALLQFESHPSVALASCIHMPKPPAVCGVCLVSAACRDDRKLKKFGRDFVSGRGNTHRCAHNAVSAKRCAHIAKCTADELRHDDTYGANLRGYASALEVSVRRYLGVGRQTLSETHACGVQTVAPTYY